MLSLFLFCLLQLLDGVTTLVFLRLGVPEGNPLVRLALGFSATPLLPVAVLKIAGCGFAFAAWRRRRMRLIGFANVLFGGCVLWNLAAISAAM